MRRSTFFISISTCYGCSRVTKPLDLRWKNVKVRAFNGPARIPLETIVFQRRDNGLPPSHWSAPAGREENEETSGAGRPDSLPVVLVQESQPESPRSHQFPGQTALGLDRRPWGLRMGEEFTIFTSPLKVRCICIYVSEPDRLNFPAYACSKIHIRYE